MTATTASTAATVEPASLDEVRRRVETVLDPELPLLTLAQLGVIRDVRLEPDVEGRPDTVVVEVTPTYSGCPAMEVIARDIEQAVLAAGRSVDVRLVRSPPWTTDWISSEGRKALQEAGIAPPGPTRGPVAVELLTRPGGGGAATPEPRPACPHCGAEDVEELSRFGSTACKSLWRCLACREPFDHVKPL